MLYALPFTSHRAAPLSLAFGLRFKAAFGLRFKALQATVAGQVVKRRIEVFVPSTPLCPNNSSSSLSLIAKYCMDMDLLWPQITNPLPDS